MKPEVGDRTPPRQEEEREDFMYQEVEASGMIERYLQGRLDPEEMDRFESHYLESPELLEQLELAEALQEGLRQTAASDLGRFLGAPAPGQTESRQTGSRQSQSSQSHARQSQPKPTGPRSRDFRQLVAIAATLLLSLTAAFALFQRLGDDRLVPAQEQTAPVTNTPVFFLGPERSASPSEPSTRIRPSSGLGGIVLALEIEGEDAATLFEARLSNQQSPESWIWTGEDLRIDHNGTLSLSFPSQFLEPGDYWLSVMPSRADADSPSTESIVRRYSFRIQPAP